MKIFPKETSFDPIWKIRTHSGYESYAVVYWDEITGSITILEESKDGKVLGSYTGIKSPKGTSKKEKKCRKK